MHVAGRTLGGDPEGPGHRAAGIRAGQGAGNGIRRGRLPGPGRQGRGSLARDHALADGNKSVALAGVLAFCGVNGRRLTLTNDEAQRTGLDPLAVCVVWQGAGRTSDQVRGFGDGSPIGVNADVFDLGALEGLTVGYRLVGQVVQVFG